MRTTPCSFLWDPGEPGTYIFICDVSFHLKTTLLFSCLSSLGKYWQRHWKSISLTLICDGWSDVKLRNETVRLIFGKTMWSWSSRRNLFWLKIQFQMYSWPATTIHRSSRNRIWLGVRNILRKLSTSLVLVIFRLTWNLYFLRRISHLLAAL